MGPHLDRFEYTIDELVIGGTLNALLYAWFTGATIICTNPKEPFFFERFSPKAKLDRIGLINESVTLNSPTGSETYGSKKSDVWRRLFMLLSMAGQAPISSTAQSIRMEDGVVKVITSHSRLARFRYKKAKIFDPSEIDAIQKNRKDPCYMVLDWMKVNTGKLHAYEFVRGDGDFINQIYFYAVTQRGGEDFKDLVAVSYLNDSELKDYSFSDTYAKFKTEHLMKEHGIKGKRNGYKKGIPCRLNVKVTPTLREVFCIDGYYVDLDKNVTYSKLTDEEILDKFKGPPKNKDVQKLLRYWG